MHSPLTNIKGVNKGKSRKGRVTPAIPATFGAGTVARGAPKTVLEAAQPRGAR